VDRGTAIMPRSVAACIRDNDTPQRDCVTPRNQARNAGTSFGLVSELVFRGRDAVESGTVKSSIRCKSAVLNAPYSQTSLSEYHGGYDTIRYDTRCYFNVRSKADTSQLNLPHGNDN